MTASLSSSLPFCRWLRISVAVSEPRSLDSSSATSEKVLAAMSGVCARWRRCVQRRGVLADCELEAEQRGSDGTRRCTRDRESMQQRHPTQRINTTTSAQLRMAGRRTAACRGHCACLCSMVLVLACRCYGLSACTVSEFAHQYLRRWCAAWPWCIAGFLPQAMVHAASV